MALNITEELTVDLSSVDTIGAEQTWHRERQTLIQGALEKVRKQILET